MPRPVLNPRKPRKIIYLMIGFAALYWFGVRHGLGRDEEKTLKVVRAPSPKRSKLEWTDDGYVKPTLDGTAEHPIIELMEKAHEKFEKQLARQSKTLKQAVAEYKRRFGLPPPVGFDSWFKFCQDNDIKFIDDYDKMMHDLMPHRALSPAKLRERTALWSDPKVGNHVYKLNVSPEAVTLSGGQIDPGRIGALRDLVDGFKHYLPAGMDVDIAGWNHDMGSAVLGRDQWERASELFSMGEFFDDPQLQRYEDSNRTPIKGWFESACEDGSAANTGDRENKTEGGHGKSFIFDHQATMDFCENPSLKRLHGTMSLDYPNRSPSQIRPLLVLCKFPGDTSFQTPALQAFTPAKMEDPAAEWDRKSLNLLFWRGSSTGGFDRQMDWRQSHRLRLHYLINGKKNGDSTWEHSQLEVMMPDGNDGFKLETRPLPILREAYTEIALSGRPVQCENLGVCDIMEDEIEFGDRVTPDEAMAFKYVLDVDGNGWSSRFQRLLSSGSVVLKATMFPEWCSEYLTPWLHYVPLKHDYSDLYDVMAFYAGPADAYGNVDSSKGHDELARHISEAALDFVRHHWRWETMQSYMFRLLLELNRLMQDDRDAASYRE